MFSLALIINEEDFVHMAPIDFEVGFPELSQPRFPDCYYDCKYKMLHSLYYYGITQWCYCCVYYSLW